VNPMLHFLHSTDHQTGMPREDCVQAIRMACVGLASELRRFYGHDWDAIGRRTIEGCKAATEGHVLFQDVAGSGPFDGTNAVKMACSVIVFAWNFMRRSDEFRRGNVLSEGDVPPYDDDLAELFVTVAQRVAANVEYEMSFLDDISPADREDVVPTGGPPA
jgi:hypothetical protein